MTADETLNELLVCLFKDLTEIEGRCLITDEFSDISINDMHIIEAIGVDEPKRSGTVAKLMSITLGTLTKAIDGLTRKGYVNRIRSEEDKRVVKLSLTDKGKSAYYHHEQFHRHMIEHIKDDLSDDEMKVLITSLAKLSDYFKVVYSDDEENQYQNWDNINEKNVGFIMLEKLNEDYPYYIDFFAIFVAIFIANAVFPMPGRAPIAVNSFSCKPSVNLSNSKKPVKYEKSSLLLCLFSMSSNVFVISSILTAK